MFGLVRKRRRQTPRLPRARLNLERLEDRAVPTLLTLSITPSGVDKRVTVSGNLLPDTVTNSSADTGSSVTNQTVQFDGAVDVAGVARKVIDLDGVVHGTAVTDARGHFTQTLQATGLGAVKAWADDGSSNGIERAVGCAIGVSSRASGA